MGCLFVFSSRTARSHRVSQPVPDGAVPADVREDGAELRDIAGQRVGALVPRWAGGGGEQEPDPGGGRHLPQTHHPRDQRPGLSRVCMRHGG